MADFDLTKTLKEIHEQLILHLQAKIVSGLATSADLALAWKLLEDNGVPLANLREQVNPEDKQAEDAEFLGSLPFPKQITK